MGLNMLKIQLLILTMKGKRIVFEKSQIAFFLNNTSLLFCMIFAVVYATLFFIYGFLNQISRENECFIDYSTYTIRIGVRYFTLEQDMSVFKWIFTLIINYFISLATLVSAIILSLRKIQTPLIFVTQNNLQDLYTVNLDDKDSKMYFFKEKSQKKKLFERGEQISLL